MASTPSSSSSASPRTRATGLRFPTGLAVRGDALYWFALRSEAEENRPIDVARAQWVRMPVTEGAPRVLASGMSANTSGFALTDAEVFWSRAAQGGMSAMPLAGGAIRSVSPESEPVQVTTNGSALFWIPLVVGRVGLFTAPTSGGPPVRLAASIESGASLVAIGAWLYWVDRGTRCVVRMAAAGGTVGSVLCDPALWPLLSAGGDRLYGVSVEITEHGESSTLFAIIDDGARAVRLRQFEGAVRAIAADSERVAVRIETALFSSTISLVSRDGAARVLATAQPNASYLALGAGHVFWTTARDVPGPISVMDAATE